MLLCSRTLTEDNFRSTTAVWPPSTSLPAGCVVNATGPSPVAGGNVETSQRIVDVVLGALAGGSPDRSRRSQRTMNNLLIRRQDTAW